MVELKMLLVCTYFIAFCMYYKIKLFILKVFIAENVCNKLGRSTEQLDTNLEGNYGTVRNYKTPQ